MANELVKTTTDALQTTTKPGLMAKMHVGWMKHGSTVLFGAGIIGAIGAGVMGAFGAIKAKKIIDEQTEKKERIKEQIDKPMMKDGKETVYTKEDAERDLRVVKRDTIIGVTKAVGPSIGLGLASVGLLIKGKVDDMRTLGNVAAYASAVEQEAARAKDILAKEVGQEKADALMAGYRTEKRTVEKVDEETGEITTSVEEVLIRDLDIPQNNMFTYTFKRGWWEWSNNRDKNIAIIRFRMREIQTRLDRNGVATLYDVMEIFDVPSDERHGWDNVCGWIWEPGRTIAVDFEILPPTSIDDPDVTFTIKTDGIIIKQVDNARKEYEKRVGLR